MNSLTNVVYLNYFLPLWALIQASPILLLLLECLGYAMPCSLAIRLPSFSIAVATPLRRSSLPTNTSKI